MDFANISCNGRKKMLLNINKKTRTEILHLFRTDRARSISTIYITENTEEFSRHTERTEGNRKEDSAGAKTLFRTNTNQQSQHQSEPNYYQST